MFLEAEEAVQDVKRAAMGELQRALTTERARAERLAAEARRQGAEETLLALGRHSQVKEVHLLPSIHATIDPSFLSIIFLSIYGINLAVVE